MLGRNATLDINFHIKISACLFSMRSPVCLTLTFFLLLFLLGCCGPHCVSLQGSCSGAIQGELFRIKKKIKMFLGFLKALWGFLPACLCSVEEMCEQWDVAAVGE